MCESGLNPKAIGDTNLTFIKNGEVFGYSSGLFQIRHLEGRPNPKWLLNPYNNISYAKTIYDIQGWQAWTCKKVIQD
jgi:hypothetical protein